MNFSGTHTVFASPELLRVISSDARRLRKIVPRCEHLLELGSRSYELSLRQRVGQADGVFTGELSVLAGESSDERLLRFELGGALGRISGQGRLLLEPVAPEETLLRYEGDATFAGGLTMYSPRMLETVLRAFLRQMTTALDRQVALMSGVVPPSESIRPELRSGAAARRWRLLPAALGFVAAVLAFAYVMRRPGHVVSSGRVSDANFPAQVPGA